MKDNRNKIGLITLFFVLISLATYICLSGNSEGQELLMKGFYSNKNISEISVKKITPVYDENSTIKVTNNNIVFNDKNQVVEYKVVIENTQDYDVKINNIKLSTPKEEFLTYKVQDLEKNDVLEAKSTKEFTIHLETTPIEGWGRNFADELTANISFEKVVKAVVEEEKKPVAPATNTEELLSKTEKIEIKKVTKNTVEFKENEKLVTGDKLAVWLYSDPVFLGYFDVIETNGIKQIVGLKEALDKVEVKSGEHNIVLSTEEGESIGYINVYIDEDKELSTTTPDTKVDNPYTSANGFIIALGIITLTIGIGIIIISKKKVAKYTAFILMLTPTLMIVNAEKVIELPIKLNVSFESQNIMKPAYTLNEKNAKVYHDYWLYKDKIKNIYIQNEITKLEEFAHKFDVTESKTGRITAYLVANKDNSNFYNLYIQADGIIYFNEDSSYYFADMKYLDKIENLSGVDTSKVTNMANMFDSTGYNSETFTLDVSNFDTSNVTDMRRMFNSTGYNSKKFTLDISNFDTSNVTSMMGMFNKTGYNSTEFTLDVSSFNTSKVIDMDSMFYGTGYSNPNFTLNVSNFDTSKVTTMNDLFNSTGYNSTNFSLDVSNFNTRNVTEMCCMFCSAGYNSPNFTLNISGLDTSNVIDMADMFYKTGYSSTKFTLDVSGFNTSNVEHMSSMFYEAGYSNPNFTLDVSNFDTSKVRYMSYMFNNTGFNSTKLNTSITISNPNVENYTEMFYNTATKEGTKIKVHYIKETETLADKMIATKTSGANVVKGNLIVDVDKLSIGDEIHISGEKFNVISQNDDTVTILAKYNLGTDYRQSTSSNSIKFADDDGWEYYPGPKEIDIQTWSTGSKQYVNEYVGFIKGELSSEDITGNLITLEELGKLGCTISPYYDNDSEDCDNSDYKDWLINDQDWWTRSAASTKANYVWRVTADGEFKSGNGTGKRGIRPTITISKETLRNLDK